MFSFVSWFWPFQAMYVEEICLPHAAMGSVVRRAVPIADFYVVEYSPEKLQT